MQTPIYNFYCLHTLAKNFYRLNPTLSYANYKFSNNIITVNCISNISNKMIVFDTDVKFKNQRFIENISYFKSDSIKYNIEIFNEMKLDSSFKLVRFFEDKGSTQKMNPYFWSNLSYRNQTELEKICDILNQFDLTPSPNNFIICK
jgi:hypothetical protein